MCFPSGVVRMVGFLVAVAVFGVTGWARASGILYQFNAPFPSDPDPASSAPWVDAYFLNVNPGTVLLTVTNVDLTSGEFIQGSGNGANGGLFFNLNPDDNPTKLVFTLVSSNGSFGPIISTGEDEFNADGHGKYDVQFDFSTHAFSAKSSLTYQITGIAGLTAADFACLSAPAGGSGPFYAAAHVQGLSCNLGGTWIEPCGGPQQLLPVPEPAPIAPLVVSLGLWAARRWRSPRAKN